MTAKVQIDINASDKTKPAIKQATMNLKEMGEKISSIGMRISAAITVPVVGILTSLNKMGSDSSKVISDLTADVSESTAAYNEAAAAYKKALAGGDKNEISKAADDMKTARDEMNLSIKTLNEVPASTKNAAKAYNDLQTAIQPVKDIFKDTAADLMTGLVPILKDMIPTIKDFANWVHDLVKGFNDMPQGQKVAVLAVIGIGAAIGPVMVIAGQFLAMLGNINVLMAGSGPAGVAGAGGVTALGTAFKGLITTTAGLVAFVGAVGLLVSVITDNWELIKAGVVVLGNLMGFKTPDWAYKIDLSKDTGTFSINNLENLAGNSNPYGGTRDTGGPVRAGTSYRIGSGVSEVFTPGEDGFVYNPSRGGGGNFALSITLPSVSLQSSDELGAKLEDTLNRWAHDKGII